MPSPSPLPNIIAAFVLLVTVITLTLAWRIVFWVWLRPKYLERCLREQALAGNSYRFFPGDLKDFSMMNKQANSKPISLDDDASLRVIPVFYHTLENYGMSSILLAATFFHSKSNSGAYSVQGVTTKIIATEMESLGVAGLFKKAASDFPSRRALLVSGKFDLTHEGLHQLVHHAARGLLAAGVAPGYVVALIFPSTTAELVVPFLAVILCRATAVPLNPSYTAEEFEIYILHPEARLLITGKEGNESAELAASELRIPHVTTTLNDGESEVSLSLSSDITAKSNWVAGISNDPSDVALFLHTSGTKSRPKGVPLTQLNLALSVRNMGSAYKFSESDETILVVPFIHADGLFVGLLNSLAAGAAVALPAAMIFSVKTFWSDIRTYNATWYTSVLDIHQINLERHLKQAKPAYPALRFIRSCSAVLAPSVPARLEEEYGAPVVEAYAMTEASQMSTKPLPEDGGHKSGSVGKPVGLEMEISDADGIPEKDGVMGEVRIRGPNVTRDYGNSPVANKAAFSFGCFHTGDVGFFDSDRYSHLKEPSNRREKIIAPIEVDEVILSHPDVDRAVAFGVPDDKHGKEHALGYTMPMRRQSINDSPALGEADVEMATNVGANGVVAADVLPTDDNLEDVITSTEAIADEAAVPSEHNSNSEDANARTIRKIGPHCLWALGCTITALLAVAALPIFGRRFTLVICAVVIAASFCRVLLEYLMWKKTPENLDIPEMSEIRTE